MKSHPLKHLRTQFQKKIWSSARVREGYYKKAYESNVVAMAFFNVEGEVFEANDAYLALCQFTREELQAGAVKWTELCHPEDKENHFLQVQKAINGETVQPYPSRLLTKNGLTRHILVGFSMLEPTGNEGVVYIMDVSAQKHSEAMLSQSEQLFRQMAEQSPLMVVRFDSNMSMVYANDAVRNISGSPMEDAENGKWISFIHPEDLENYFSQWMHAFNNRVPYEIKFRFRSHDRGFIWINASCSPMLDEKGQFQGYLAILTDIDEQEKAKRMARELNEKKDEFISIASHELKRPITTLKASLQISQMMVKESNTDALMHYLEKAVRHAETLDTLVNELLDVNKLQSGNMHLIKTRFPLRELLNDCRDYINSIAPEFNVEIHGNADMEVYGDKTRIQQVLQNLLSNAIKYSGRTKSITLHEKSTSDYFKLSVIDKGLGISKEAMEKIFEKFYRSELNRRQVDGLGLGLYISNLIIKAHNGVLEVESELGEGSSFTVCLPHFSSQA